ncbi:hypothetical protein KI387_032412, partial [Taxus chinensis]
EEEAQEEINEEVVVMMERLEEEILVDHSLNAKLSSSYSSYYSCANCCVQSDSAFSMSSSSSRLSSPMECELKCRCHSQDEGGHNGYVFDELGYLLEASDEELGIPTDNNNGVCTNGILGDSFLALSNNAVGINTEAGDLEMWEMVVDECYEQSYFYDDDYSFVDFMTETDTELTL